MPATQQMKTDAMAFYGLMFNQCQPRAALEQFAGATYRQHNTEVADGKEAFIAYFERMQAEYLGKHVEFKRAVAEGDLVVLHCFSNGPAITTTPAWTSSASMTTARSSSTGTFSKSCPTPPPTTTPCSDGTATRRHQCVDQRTRDSPGDDRSGWPSACASAGSPIASPRLITLTSATKGRTCSRRQHPGSRVGHGRRYWVEHVDCRALAFGCGERAASHSPEPNTFFEDKRTRF